MQLKIAGTTTTIECFIIFPHFFLVFIFIFYFDTFKSLVFCVCVCVCFKSTFVLKSY